MWINNISEDLASLGLTLRGAVDVTNDQRQWRLFIVGNNVFIE